MSDNCCNTPATSNCPPSGEPPWSRSRRHVIKQTIFGDDNVSLTADPTYLEKTISDPSVPVAITIPDGNAIGESKQIYIRFDKMAATETFILSGTFSGFQQLQFDAVGHSAVLIWEGESWKYVGGAAIAII